MSVLLIPHDFDGKILRDQVVILKNDDNVHLELWNPKIIHAGYLLQSTCRRIEDAKVSHGWSVADRGFRFKTNCVLRRWQSETLK